MTDRATDDRRVLDGHGVAAALLDDWRLLFAALHGRFRTGDFATGMAFVDRIAAEADRADHHPDIDLRWRTLHLTLVTHSAGGVTAFDLELARRIDALLP